MQDVRGVEGRKEEETRRMVRMGGESNDRSDGIEDSGFLVFFFSRTFDSQIAVRANQN